MKRFASILAALMLPFSVYAQERTLRVDYIFSGTSDSCEISVDELRSLDGWAGRRTRMAELPLRGNGQALMRDAASGELLYATSFSTLFQEWQATEEATRVRKSFENVFLFPMPESPVEITVQLFDFMGKVSASFTHPVDPSDILIRPAKGTGAPFRYILKAGSPDDCIDVAIVPEGYTEAEMDRFYEDAKAATDEIMGYEPFNRFRDRFNFVAIGEPSAESGVSIPKKGLWLDTAVSSGFDTFYSDRYLTTLHLKRLHDILAAVPYEHIIILANTENYGGGGIYNSYEMTAAHHALFKPVVVHEFGHSFAGLADEYYYDDQYENYYNSEVEPWEQNITTKVDFESKWKDMMHKKGVGLVEGGGYMSKGVWRASKDCRMKTNECPGFCPVCVRAIENLIRFYTDTDK